MARLAEIEILRGCGERVAVEHEPTLAAVAWRTADQLVLATFAILPEIGIGPIRCGHAGIVLLDAPPHLAHQGLLQRLGWSEDSFGVAVLGLEIGPDVRTEQL